MNDYNIKYAKENASLKLANKVGPESYERQIAELQQRIAELEDKAASFEGSFNAALKDIQRLDAALGEALILANTVAGGNFNQSDVITHAKELSEQIDKLRAGDIRDDHCLTPDEYDGKARAGE